MHVPVAFGAALTMLLGSGAWAQSSPLRLEAVSQPPPSNPPTPDDQIHFDHDPHERMTVPVELAGKGPFRFLVDTGADRTAVSRELAVKLGLASAPDAILNTATGQSRVAMAVIRDLTLSRRAIGDVDAPLLDAKEIGADGILGIDSLRSHRVIFDFVARSLSITPAETPVSADDAGAIVIRAKRRRGRLVVTDASSAGQHVSVMLDSGSQLSVGNRALRRKLEARGGITLIGPIDLISVTGESIRGELVTVDRIEIGGAVLIGLAMVFAEADTFRQLGLQRWPAMLLGMNGFRSFDRVSIDFASRKLRLVVATTRDVTSATTGNQRR